LALTLGPGFTAGASSSASGAAKSAFTFFSGAGFATATGAAAGAVAQDDGWITLFDGKTLNGWQQCNGQAKYEVAGGAIGVGVPSGR